MKSLTKSLKSGTPSFKELQEILIWGRKRHYTRLPVTFESNQESNAMINIRLERLPHQKWPKDGHMAAKGGGGGGAGFFLKVLGGGGGVGVVALFLFHFCKVYHFYIWKLLYPLQNCVMRLKKNYFF